MTLFRRRFLRASMLGSVLPLAAGLGKSFQAATEH